MNARQEFVRLPKDPAQQQVHPAASRCEQSARGPTLSNSRMRAIDKHFADILCECGQPLRRDLAVQLTHLKS